jgi:hypothetical protein
LPAQLFARSPKLRIYESLFLLNQGVDHVIATLRRMEKFSFADKESLHSPQAEIEEVRACTNADFAERLSDCERSHACRFWKQRRAFEKTWRDPDDVYLDLERREKESKKQGSPSRLGVISYSALSNRKNAGDRNNSAIAVEGVGSDRLG